MNPITPIFKKLNFKEQKTAYILNSPPEFLDEINEMKMIAIIKSIIKENGEIEFILTFVKTKQEIEDAFSTILKKIALDGIIWFAYPKKTSSQYSIEISRDKGWDILRDNGFDTVRSVSIDDDWSALRFRRVEFIKRMIK